MRAIVSLAICLVFAAAAAAQEKLSVRGPDPATVRLGDASRVELVVEGRSSAPRAPQLPTVDGLELECSPPARQSFSYFDGRTMVEQFSVRFTIGIRPQREGSFTIPPIAIWTGTLEQRTPELRLEAVKDLRGEEFGYLLVEPSPARVYVHEPIRMKVEFGVDAGLRPVLDRASNGARYVDFEVQAPWLTDLEGAVVVNEPEPQGNRVQLVLNRMLQSGTYEQQYQREGRQWQRFTFERTYLPTRPGRLELAAPLLRYNVLVREGRQAENFYVYGKPLVVEVLPIPVEGRPDPYFGAVGRFTIDAQVDRDTVKVGGTVRVTLSIRGSGNLEFLRVPALDDLAGFHKLGQTESRKPGEVVVDYDLTPLVAEITEIPAIAWNWFDTTPGVEAFVAARTKPIPLHVQPLPPGATLAPLPAAAKATVPGVDDIHDVREPDGVVRLPSTPGGLLAILAVALPWLLALSFPLRSQLLRRREATAGQRRARAAAGQCQKRLAQGADPADALADYLADRLGTTRAAVIGPDLVQRLAAAGIAEAVAMDAAAALERGVAARYGGGTVLGRDEVLAIVGTMESSGRSAIGALVLCAAMGLLAGNDALRAQQDVQSPEAAAMEAWRKGDHAAARAGFEAAIASNTLPDRRLFYNLGNCHYRLGDLARARWAWECARLGMPRDPELLANLALVEKQLPPQQDGAEPFLAAVAGLRDSLTGFELLALCVLCNLVAALGLVVFWRRPALRAAGAIALLPALGLTAELLVFGPQRPPRAIVTAQAAMRSEPREAKELPVLATLAPGAAVEWLGTSGDWARVKAAGRSGYVPAAAVEAVR